MEHRWSEKQSGNLIVGSQRGCLRASRGTSFKPCRVLAVSDIVLRQDAILHAETLSSKQCLEVNQGSWQFAQPRAAAMDPTEPLGVHLAEEHGAEPGHYRPHSEATNFAVVVGKVAQL